MISDFGLFMLGTMEDCINGIFNFISRFYARRIGRSYREKSIYYDTFVFFIDFKLVYYSRMCSRRIYRIRIVGRRVHWLDVCNYCLDTCLSIFYLMDMLMLFMLKKILGYKISITRG